jgi:hypothetical protein
MFAPSNIEKNLDENFGNWKIPDKGYISHLESPSTMNTQCTDYQITSRMQILSAVKSKNTLKLKRLEKILDKNNGSIESNNLITKIKNAISIFEAGAK